MVKMEINKILEQLDQYVKDECTDECDECKCDECTKLEFERLPSIDVLFAHRKNPYSTKSELKENIREFFKTCELYKEELSDDAIVLVFSLLSLTKKHSRNVEQTSHCFLALVEYVLNTYA